MSRILDTNWTGMVRFVDDDCACGAGDDCKCDEPNDGDTLKESEVKRIKRESKTENKRIARQVAKDAKTDAARREVTREMFIESMTSASRRQ